MEMNQHEIERNLIEALGLPKNTTSLSLLMDAGQPMVVCCEYIPHVKSAPMERATKLLKLARFEDDDPQETKFREARQRLHECIDLHCKQAHMAIHRATTEARSTLDMAYATHLISTERITIPKDVSWLTAEARANCHA
jgi:hypothetical protein